MGAWSSCEVARGEHADCEAENGQQSDENHYFSCWMAVELALDASAGVAGVRTRDLESIFVGFAQPARC